MVIKHRRTPDGSFFVFLIFSWLLLLLTQNLLSQYYSAGTDPSSVKWKQVETPHFRLIYPCNFERHAQYIANGLEYIYLPSGRTLNVQAPKIPVILHTQTTIPSSVTPYAPKRIDLFTTPPQDIYPQDWIDQLIIHEFRHANQYAALNRGFTRALTYLLGEQTIPAMIALYVPLWFMEGDATLAETAFHYTGRGRSPTFEMHLRAQFIQKKIYSYDKALSGSFRDFVPDKYEIGYQMVGLTRELYGEAVWGGVLKNVGRYPFSVVPFSSSLKKQTGFRKHDLYRSLTAQMQNTWIETDKKIVENDYRIISKPSGKKYVNYNLPVSFRDSLILAERSSIDDLTTIVLLNRNGTEKRLFTAGAGYMEESLSASDSNIYWSEMALDPRWSFRDYRVIKKYNFNTGQISQITRHTRYFAPSVSKDGRFLASVDITPDNLYSIVILNTNGKLLRKIDTPENLFFIHPRWSEDSRSIVTVVSGKEGNSIAIADPETGNLELLLPYTFREIKRPSFFRDYVLFTASYSGINNIYAINRSSHEIFKITSSRFGASDASVAADQSCIFYSDYTSDGNRLVSAKLEPGLWQKFSPNEAKPFPMAEIMTKQENFIFNTDSVPKIKYPEKPYSKGLNLFNFHSWMPLGLDIQNVKVSPGVTLLSQNLLGTSNTTLGYAYNRNQETGKYFLQYTYEGLYPAIDLNADYGHNRTNINRSGKTIPIMWEEINLNTTFRLPLRWYYNDWIQRIQPSVGFSYKYRKMEKPDTLRFTQERIKSMNYTLTASNLLKSSYRDIYPSWGQLIRINFSHDLLTPGDNSIFSGEANFYFPGIAKHHSLQLYAAYQKKTDYYNGIIIYPRGYIHIYDNNLESFSATYSMPLFYPDWQIGPVLFIKRFKAAVFYDYARGMDQVPYKIYASTGLDLTMDLNILSFIAPFDTGLRAIYSPESGNFVFQFLFNVSINSIY
jgi:hypothetical protein